LSKANHRLARLTDHYFPAFDSFKTRKMFFNDPDQAWIKQGPEHIKTFITALLILGSDNSFSGGHYFKNHCQ
jgi:hypothetical protein